MSTPSAPAWWPPPHDEAGVHRSLAYARERNPLGDRIHVVIAAVVCFSLPVSTAGSGIAFAPLAIIAAVRLWWTWRTYAALLAPLLLWSVVAWVAWQAASLGWSDDRAAGADELGALRMVALPWAVWPIIDRWPSLVRAFLAGVLVQNGIQVLQLVETGRLFDAESPLRELLAPKPDGRVPGLLHPIQTGMMCAASMCFCLSAIVRERGIGRWAAVAAFAAAAFGLVVTGSRGPWVAAAAVLPLQLLVMAWRRPALRRPVAIAAIVTGALAALALPLVGASVVQRTRDAVEEMRSARDEGVMWSSVGLRLSLWSWAWQIHRDAPVRGVGAGGFLPALRELPAFRESVERAYEDAFRRHIPDYDAARRDGRPIEGLRGYRRAERLGRQREDYLDRGHAHSTYLHQLSEQGWIGLALLAVMLALLLRQAWRSPPDSVFADAPFFVILAWVIGGQFDAYHLNGHLMGLLMVAFATVMPRRVRLGAVVGAMGDAAGERAPVIVEAEAAQGAGVPVLAEADAARGAGVPVSVEADAARGTRWARAPGHPKQGRPIQGHADRAVATVAAMVLSALVLYLFVTSIREIIQVNDFEVFHHVGKAAVEHRADIYDLVSPIKKRGPFLYPPSAAVFFVPLGWMSHDVAGVVFSVVKTACLVVLVLGAVRCCGRRLGRTEGLLVALAAFIVVFRPINNDYGNGQVNLIVSAAAAGGVWMMMAGGRAWRWLGAVPLAFAIALKLTPILLCAVPLLNRRWGALGATLVATVLLAAVLPAAWFGPSELAAMRTRYADVMGAFLTEARDRPRQLTANEMVQFTAAQIQSDPEGYELVNEELHRREGTALVPARLPEPMSRGAATTIWLAIGLAGGAGYLLLRRRYARDGRIDWTWDLAILCVLMMLLPPQVRKAHLVILFVPAAWSAARLLRLIQIDGWPAALARHGASFVLFGLCTAAMLASDDVAVPIPGFPMPYRPGVFLGMVFLLVLVAWLPREEGGLSAPSRQR